MLANLTDWKTDARYKIHPPCVCSQSDRYEIQDYPAPSFSLR